MKHRFSSYDEMRAFAEARGRNYQRTGLLGEWNKWRRGDLERNAVVCDHEGSLTPWDCGCSFGCGCCNLVAQCSECHSNFAQKKNPPMSVTLEAQ